MAKFCSNCGKAVEDNQQVCLNCGVLIDGNKNAKSANTTVNSGTKSKVVAGILGLFFGAWGVHNFYLGFSGKAFTQIIVTIFTCGIGGIWGFIEGIMILCGTINTDANGNALSD